MAYTVEQINDCTKKLVFNFETVDLTQEIDKALKEKQRSANLKGFRKGKAPLSMVQKVFGPQIENDALQSFVRNQFMDAVEKENLNMVGYPRFDNMNYEGGKSVKFDATVEVFPQVELNDYSSLSFTKEKVELGDGELETQEKNLLESKSTLEELPEGAKVENGHHVVINFQGEKEDGEKPENMKGEDFVLEIGSGQFIPGFEEGLIGWTVGKKDIVDLSFPADYHVEDLKDASVKFEVELLEIKAKKLPEFTDELAKEFNFDSVEDFRSKTKERILAQKERQANEKLHQEILEKLIEENDFTVPQALVDQQKDYLKQEMGNNLSQQGFTPEMLEQYYGKWEDDFNQKSTFQVKSGLILDTLAKKYNVEASEADLQEKLETSAQEAGAQVEEVKKYYDSNPQVKKNMMYAIREEKTFDELKKEIKIS